MNDTFIPGGVPPKPGEIIHDPRGPVRIRILNDYRLRLPGMLLLVGDEASMSDGSKGRVVTYRKVGSRLFIVKAPEEVCRDVFGPDFPYEDSRLLPAGEMEPTGAR